MKGKDDWIWKCVIGGTPLEENPIKVGRSYCPKCYDIHGNKINDGREYERAHGVYE